MNRIRLQRVGDQVRAVLADLLHRRVHDPRLASVMLTEVRVSPDLHQAIVYYSVYPADENELEEADRALERAAGFLRRELGSRVRLKVTPELDFRHDTSAGQAERIERLIDEVKADPPVPPLDEPESGE